MKNRQRTNRSLSDHNSSRRGKKHKSLLQPLLLLLFSVALFYGAYYFFSDHLDGDEDALPEVIEEAPPESPEQVEETGLEDPEDLEPAPVQEQDDPDSADLSEPVAVELQVITDGDYLLALVTKETTLKSSYAPTNLVRISDYMFPARELWLREEAYRQLEQLWQAATDDGITLTIISAYRSYDYQKTLFQNYANSYGEEAANRFSARAGQSEHQLGTTVDFGGTAVDLKAAFADTEQGRWLADNAYQFGFAMSYPEGKEKITGYIFEPWHYRYIGLEAAAAWHEAGLSLKEFLQQKPQFFE
ncbi:MAG: M15 family metallopeptidase [Firmicutes bacterium]|nr:M15 family metallopeptidase [Bacillota bacterium]